LKRRPEEDIPRPPYWNGYRVKPAKIEFWIDGDYRLHQRYLYTKEGDDWEIGMLYP
jgi:pyridoxamine 5'-phosphate oxidase